MSAGGPLLGRVSTVIMVAVLHCGHVPRRTGSNCRCSGGEGSHCFGSCSLIAFRLLILEELLRMP